jgi:hypothetical protein
LSTPDYEATAIWQVQRGESEFARFPREAARLREAAQIAGLGYRLFWSLRRDPALLDTSIEWFRRAGEDNNRWYLYDLLFQRSQLRQRGADADVLEAMDILRQHWQQGSNTTNLDTRAYAMDLWRWSVRDTPWWPTEVEAQILQCHLVPGMLSRSRQMESADDEQTIRVFGDKGPEAARSLLDLCGTAARWEATKAASHTSLDDGWLAGVLSLIDPITGAPLATRVARVALAVSEWTRGRWLDHMTADRAGELAQLRMMHPAFAERLQAALDAVDSISDDTTVQERDSISQQVSNAYREIRAQAGFGSFHRPPPARMPS